MKLPDILAKLRLRATEATVEDAAGFEAQRPNAAAEGIDVCIVFSDVAWRMVLSGAGEDGLSETRQGDLFDVVDEAGDGEWAAGLRAALQALAPGERADVRSIEIYPFAACIEVFDNRSVRAFGADKASLKRIAEDLTGAAECAFDRMAVGESADDRYLIAVTDMDVIRRSAAILGDLAPKLTRISPASAAWLAEAAKFDDRARSILHIGRSSSVLISIDATSKVIAVRTAPVGLLSLGRMVADINSLPLAEAMKEMAARDMLGRAASAGSDEALRTLAALVRDTAAYMSESRLAEPPDVIELIGAQEAAWGLAELLQERIGLEIAIEQSDATPPIQPDDMNLLQSIEGTLFSEGAREYRFEDGRFVADEAEKRGARSPAKAGDDGAPRRFAGIELPRMDAEVSPKRLAAMAAAVAGALIFFFYDMAIAPSASAHGAAASALEVSLQRSAALNDKLGRLRSNARRDALLAAGSNKILWAEKFVSIASALPPSLWLTEASIARSDRRVGDVEVVATKLVLRGIARAGGDRRLQDIASFIDTLEQDEEFMRDFRAVAFAGLGGQDGVAGGGATFEVHAWYDENKRRTTGVRPGVGSDPLSAARAAAASRQAFTGDGGVLGGGGAQ